MPKLLKLVWRSLRQNCDVCEANSTARSCVVLCGLPGLKTGLALHPVKCHDFVKWAFIPRVNDSTEDLICWINSANLLLSYDVSWTYRVDMYATAHCSH